MTRRPRVRAMHALRRPAALLMLAVLCLTLLPVTAWAAANGNGNANSNGNGNANGNGNGNANGQGQHESSPAPVPPAPPAPVIPDPPRVEPPAPQVSEPQVPEPQIPAPPDPEISKPPAPEVPNPEPQGKGLDPEDRGKGDDDCDHDHGSGNDAKCRAVPSAPSDLAAIAGDGKVTLVWTAVAGATGYRVRFGPEGDSHTRTEESAQPTLEIDGLVNGVEYAFAVRAENAAGASDYTDDVLATPVAPQQVPAAPAAVVATPLDGAVALAWTGSPDADTYEFRSRPADGTWSGDTSTTATSATVEGLSNGQAYEFEVRARNEAGASGYASATATPVAVLVVPAVPGRPVATAGDARVDLSWDAVEGATGYEVGYRAGAGAGAYTTQAAATAGAAITGLTNGVLYEFVVKAVNAAGASDWSQAATATPVAAIVVPGQPTGWVVQAGVESVDLAWQPVAGATKYHVWRSTAADGVFTLITPSDWSLLTTPVTAVDRTAVAGTTYYYKVSALNAAGEGPVSAVSGAVTPLPPAPVVTGLSPASGSVAGGDLILIAGTNLSGAEVTFGGVAAQVVLVGEGGLGLIVRAPAGSLAVSVAVTVSTAGGSTSAGSYLYLPISVPVPPPAPPLVPALVPPPVPPAVSPQPNTSIASRPGPALSLPSVPPGAGAAILTPRSSAPVQIAISTGVATASLLPSGSGAPAAASSGYVVLTPVGRVTDGAAGGGNTTPVGAGAPGAAPGTTQPGGGTLGEAVHIEVVGIQSGEVEVCVPFDPARLPRGAKPSSLKLVELSGGREDDVTRRVDVRGSTVCGVVSISSMQGARAAVASAGGVGRMGLTARTVPGAATPCELGVCTLVAVVYPPAGPEYEYIGSDLDPVQSAAGIADTRFASGVPVVYIANGETYADVLALGPASIPTGGPILLVSRDAVPESTRVALTRLHPGRIVILGGLAAVSAAVEAALGGFAPQVSRIAGADRYDTAAAMLSASFPAHTPVVFVATGDNFPDAIAGGAAAARLGAPLVLVQTGGIPAGSAAQLTRLRPERIIVLGGPAAVGHGAMAQLAAYATGSVERMGGADRYLTAVLVARQIFPEGARTVYLAAGTDFGAALAGVPAAAQEQAPILFTGGAEIPAIVRDELERMAPERIVILGAKGDDAELLRREVSRLQRQWRSGS